VDRTGVEKNHTVIAEEKKVEVFSPVFIRRKHLLLAKVYHAVLEGSIMV
jgi:hypothetical protein